MKFRELTLYNFSVFDTYNMDYRDSHYGYLVCKNKTKFNEIDNKLPWEYQIHSAIYENPDNLLNALLDGMKEGFIIIRKVKSYDSSRY